MGQSRDDFIAATGGFFAHPLEQRTRLRIRELSDKSVEHGLSDAEKVEMLKLLESLPDADD